MGKTADAKQPPAAPDGTTRTRANRACEATRSDPAQKANPQGEPKADNKPHPKGEQGEMKPNDKPWAE